MTDGSRIRWLAGLSGSLALSSWAGRSLLQPEMLFGHSAVYDYVRQVCYDLAVRDGVLYPRWITEFYNGYGSPIFVFYAPLFYALSELFCLIGAPVLYGLKLARFSAFLAAGPGMFLLARRHAGPWGAWIASALFVFSNYVLVDAYVRTASAELLALAFSPYLILFLLRLSDRPSLRRMILFSLAHAIMILTHNIAALMWSGVIVAYGIWTAAWTRRLKTVSWIASGLLLALLLSAFFWLPALQEQKFIQGGLTDGYYAYDRHFVGIAQLWEDRWGYGAATEDASDEMSLSAGRVFFLAWLAAFLVIVLWRKHPSDRKREAWFFSLASLASLLMILALSRPVWGILPLIRNVQFPWRFYLLFVPLSLSAFAFAFGELEGKRPRWSAVVGLLLVAATLWSQAPRARGYPLRIDMRAGEPVRVVEGVPLRPGLVDPVKTFDVETIRRAGFSGTSVNEYAPVWSRRSPPGAPGRVFETNERAMAELVDRKRLRLRLDVQSAQGGVLYLNSFYYPGWRALANGRDLSVKAERGTGRMTVFLEPGSYQVQVRFDGSRLIRSCSVVSLATLFITLILLGKPEVIARRRRRLRERTRLGRARTIMPSPRPRHGRS